MRLSVAALGVLTLTGCATIMQTPTGTPIAEVVSAFGEPTTTCHLPNGAERAVWSQQPLGQYAWTTIIDQDGRVGEITQILDDQFFRLLDKGAWTPEMVTCQFGPPAEIRGVGLPSVRKTVWSYRYKQYGAWNMLMNVFFDPETQLVVGHSPAPDPMFEYWRWPVWF